MIDGFCPHGYGEDEDGGGFHKHCPDCLQAKLSESQAHVAALVEAGKLVVKVAAIGIPSINKMMAEVEEKSGRTKGAYFSGEVASIVMRMIDEMNDTIINLSGKCSPAAKIAAEYKAMARENVAKQMDLIGQHESAKAIRAMTEQGEG